MSKILTLLETVQAKRLELREQVKAVLADGIRDFMKDHPEVKALGWTQYTPYFNDGDTCEFSVGSFYASFTENQPSSFYEDEPEDLDEGSWHELYSYKGAKVPAGCSAETWADLNKFTNALSGADEDMLAAFGDHVQVIVTQTGVDIEEYEHD